MTLEEAIAMLERHYVLRLSIDRAILFEASKLGIEALKWRRAWVLVNRNINPPPLPGETEE